MDNAPNTLFLPSLTPEMDAYFVQEGGGWLSQYFFAASPRHPIMFLAVHDVLNQMANLLDVGNFYVPVVSGPGATKRAFLHFMDLNATNADAVAGAYSKPDAGHYVSTYYPNHSVDVVGSRQTGNNYVIRDSVRGPAKGAAWVAMNVTVRSTGISMFRLLFFYYI